MTDVIHPDATFALLSKRPEVESSQTRSSALAKVHQLCAELFANGARVFLPSEVGKALADKKVMPASTYMCSFSPERQDLGRAWQVYADAVDLCLIPDAPPGHPDAVVARLIAAPKRGGGRTIRAIYKACKARFDRGEMNFNQAALAREGEQTGLFTAEALRGGYRRGYGEILEAWQKFSDDRIVLTLPSTAVADGSDENARRRLSNPQRFRASLDGLPDDDPFVVFSRLLKERRIKTSSVQQLHGIHEVCSARFESGHYDFGRSAMARALSDANVFRKSKHLPHSLAVSPRFSVLLDAWQARADVRWIDFNADLPLTNPHSVFRRLREKPFKSNMQETLLALHRACYLEHKAGNLDFSLKRIGELLERRGVIERQSLKHSVYDEFRTLIKAWDEFARPWLAVDGAPPPSVRTNRRDSENPDLEWVRRDHPEIEGFRALASEWLQTAKGGLGQRVKSINSFFSNYLLQGDIPKTPGEFFRRGVLLPNIPELAFAEHSREVHNNYLHEFFDWILLRDFSGEADDGELLVSPEFRNPLKAVSVARKGGPSQSVRSPLPYGYIHTLRRMIAEGPNFKDWRGVQGLQGAADGEIGRPGRAWFEVDRAQIDEDDPDCVWRVRTMSNGRVVHQMWSPVRWVALLIKLLTPLRTMQVRVLDSGESDTWKLKNGVWVLNDHPLAHKNQKKPWQQGVLRRIVDSASREQPVSTVLYISTNKTADMDKAGPHKGYTMAWHAASDPLDNVYYWLEKMRNWQSKYNPVKRRTSWLELGSKHIAVKTDEQLRAYADTCFLFREAEASAELRNLPITDSTLSYAWFNLLESLQNNLAAKGETHEDGSAITFVVRSDNGSRERIDFPLHSLRVSLITALALDGGVPFEILQKLVGHTRLIMTLYYTKVSHGRMSTTLAQAAEKLGQSKEAATIRFLRDTKHDQLVKRAICNNSISLSAAIPIHPGERNPAGWMLMHHGICLVGGNVSEMEGGNKIGGCYNGGAVGGTSSKATFSPVPGGARNCVRCRWFVTEPHYLHSLSAHFNNSAYRFDEARNRAIEAERNWQELLRAEAAAEISGAVFTDVAKVDAAERVMESTAVVFSDRAEDLVATWRLIERCIGVLNSTDGEINGTHLVIQGGEAEVKAIFEEVDSELLQLCGVCDDLQLYPDLQAEKAVIRRSQLLDSALFNEGLPPMFMLLTEDEQLKAGNAFVQRLARAASPDNPYIGRREVVRVIDAGKKLGASLGIELQDTVRSLRANPQSSFATLSD